MNKYPVIDTHYHLGTCSGRCSNEEFMKEWTTAGKIDIQFIMQPNEGCTYVAPDWNPCLGNDFIAGVEKANPGKIWGLATIYPWWQPPKVYMGKGPKEGQPFDLVTRNPAVEETERCFLELGLHGLKAHPFEHHHQINNPYIMFPIYDKMTEVSKKTGKRLFVFVHAAGDDIGDTPEAMYDAAKRYPELLFIAAHSAYYQATPTVATTMAELDNVLLDLTTVASPLRLRDAYKKFGPTKFCAGSDGPVASVAVKNQIVNLLTDDEEERALIQGGNLCNQLGIEWDGNTITQKKLL